MIVNYLLSPLIKGVILLTNPVVKYLRGNIKEEMAINRDEEIRFLVSAGVTEGSLEKETERNDPQRPGVRDKVVREVMIPRIDMECVNIGLEKEKFIDAVVEAGFSRVPVYKENLDNIIGIIHVKDC